MRRDLSVDFLVASGEGALHEAGATSEELSAILRARQREDMAREIVMWSNPAEWARYTLVSHRLYTQVTGADPAEQPI